MNNKHKIATFQDVSDWNVMNYYKTGGTRNKQILQKPNSDDLYFFKTSLKKEKMDYKHEFWSEIIASKIGQQLEFNMLDYNIAYCNGEIGCLSKSMINSDMEELSEGIQYLMGTDSTYNPTDKSSYDKYTFSFIEKALKEYKLEQKIPEIIKTIIFDSIIGNSDRHQENWGFIVSKINLDYKSRKFYNRLVGSGIFKSILKLQSPKNSNTQLIDKSKNIDSFLDKVKGRYAPIYDSGSCLGREIVDEKVRQMLTDQKQLEKYISKGVTEIRWDKEKISHNILIENIKNRTKHSQIIKDELTRLSECFNKQIVRDIVITIDNQLPEELIKYKLPEERKELIIKIVTLRFEKLQGLI
jgi:hypothetical protein